MAKGKAIKASAPAAGTDGKGASDDPGSLKRAVAHLQQLAPKRKAGKVKDLIRTADGLQTKDAGFYTTLLRLQLLLETCNTPGFKDLAKVPGSTEAKKEMAEALERTLADVPGDHQQDDGERQVLSLTMVVARAQALEQLVRFLAPGDEERAQHLLSYTWRHLQPRFSKASWSKDWRDPKPEALLHAEAAASMTPGAVCADLLLKLFDVYRATHIAVATSNGTLGSVGDKPVPRELTHESWYKELTECLVRHAGLLQQRAEQLACTRMQACCCGARACRPACWPAQREQQRHAPRHHALLTCRPARLQPLPRRRRLSTSGRRARSRRSRWSRSSRRQRRSATRRTRAAAAARATWSAPTASAAAAARRRSRSSSRSLTGKRLKPARRRQAMCVRRW